MAEKNSREARRRTQTVDLGRRMLRPKKIQAKLGIGNTMFWEMVKAGRIRLVNLGPKARAAPEEEIDALMDEMIAERDGAEA